eukprot:494061_1
MKIIGQMLSPHPVEIFIILLLLCNILLFHGISGMKNISELNTEQTSIAIDKIICILQTDNESQNYDIHMLIKSLNTLINNHLFVKLSLAKDPKRTMDLFFPIILRFTSNNQSFYNFPNVSLPHFIQPNTDLPIQFYQTITTISTDTCTVGKLYGLKMVDTFTNKQQLKDIPMNAIISLATSDNNYINKQHRRCDFDIIYDRKYYDTDTQYWASIRNVCNTQSFQHFINNNFKLKLQLVNNPGLVKNIIFPMIVHYRTKMDSSLSGFPDIRLPNHSQTNDRAVLFYEILTQCINDKYFAERLYGLKVIDYYQDKQILLDVSFVDIQIVLHDHRGKMHSFRQSVIIDTIYNPYYYPSIESFVSFIGTLHYEFMIEQKTPYEGAVNKAGVDWFLAVNYWWTEAIQMRLQNAVGFNVLSKLNTRLLLVKT